MKLLPPVIIAIATLMPSAFAQVSIVTTITDISHEYNPVSGYAQDYIVGQLFGGTAAPSFTTDISTTNTVSWRISAPEGYKFVAQASPSTFSTVIDFGFGFWYAGGTIGVFDAAGQTTSDFDFISGAFTSNNVTFFVSRTGNAAKFSGTLGLSTTPVEFTSMTFVGDFSNITSRTGWDLGTYSPDGTLIIKTFMSGLSSGDPGPAISLVPIPEPSSVALLLGAFAIGLVVFRKKG